MLVSVLFGLAEADAVDDGGVVELVREDGVLGAEDLLEEARVRVEAAGVQDCVLAAVELGNLALEVLQQNEIHFMRGELLEKGSVPYRVDILRATDETHGTQARSVASERGDGGVDYFGVALKPVALLNPVGGKNKQNRESNKKEESN